jgi:hypothetical protein
VPASSGDWGVDRRSRINDILNPVPWRCQAVKCFGPHQAPLERIIETHQLQHFSSALNNSNSIRLTKDLNRRRIARKRLFTP